MITISDLSRIGWSLEELEEFLGFPRGWTDVAEPGESLEGHDERRLQALRQHGGDWTLDDLRPKSGSE